MKIYLNSLKGHQAFPYDTDYKLSFAHSNEEILEGNPLHFPDIISDSQLESIGEIIQHANSLKNILPPSIFNEIIIQVNANDYYDHVDQNKFERYDFSSVHMYAYPKDKALIWGLNYKENHYVTYDITKHFTTKEEVNFTLFHEVSHILEYISLEDKIYSKENKLSIQILNFLNEHKTQQIKTDTISNNPLQTMLMTLSSEMYADTMAVLFIHHVSNDKQFTLNFLDKIIKQREQESLYSVTSKTSHNGLPYAPGITSDHFTLPALQKLKNEIEFSPQHITSLNDMNQLVEKCVSFGLMKNILFMSKVEQLQPLLITFFNNVLNKEMSKNLLDDLLEKEVDSFTVNEMAEILSDEKLNKSDQYQLNKNKFKAVFHPTVWKEENTPVRAFSPEEAKAMIESMRKSSLHNPFSAIQSKVD